MSVDKESPIGVFDSGVGGLTVVKEMSKHLPGERVIYFGDTANVPYGDKDPARLIRLADSIVSFLVANGVKAVVDACNSTSAVALDYLRGKYEVPFVGVIDAGVRAALENTKNGKVGVIATKATVESQAHKRAAEKLDPKVRIFGRACPLFVPLVEEGKTDCPEVEAAAEMYLAFLQDAGIDTLILGCTHYPFITAVIRRVLGDRVVLVDPAENTAKELKVLLKGEIREDRVIPFSEHKYFVSGDPVAFKEVGERLLSASLGEVTRQKL